MQSRAVRVPKGAQMHHLIRGLQSALQGPREQVSNGGQVSEIESVFKQT